MIDTGRTVSLAARLLKENGAKAIYVIVSHGKHNCVKVPLYNLLMMYFRSLCGGQLEAISDIANRTLGGDQHHPPNCQRGVM